LNRAASKPVPPLTFARLPPRLMESRGAGLRSPIHEQKTPGASLEIVQEETMLRKMSGLIAVCFLLSVGRALAQAPDAAVTPAALVPAASPSQIECSGFIAGSSVSTGFHVSDGADNDFRQPFRQFTTGNFVFLRGEGGNPTVGKEYRLVRRSTGAILGGDALPLFGRATWYPGQERAIHSLGHAYEDVGRVKVTTLTPEGAVAEVTFGCTSVAPGDVAVPFTARPIPTYDVSHSFDRFAQTSEGRRGGTIVAGTGNDGALGNGSTAFVDLGEGEGARPGKRYRIIHRDRETIVAGPRLSRATPTETIGELVILFTQERSSVATVVSCVREVSLGDGIAAE
jgi:hypothetical protein